MKYFAMYIVLLMGCQIAAAQTKTLSRDQLKAKCVANLINGALTFQSINTFRVNQLSDPSEVIQFKIDINSVKFSLKETLTDIGIIGGIRWYQFNAQYKTNNHLTGYVALGGSFKPILSKDGREITGYSCDIPERYYDDFLIVKNSDGVEILRTAVLNPNIYDD